MDIAIRDNKKDTCKLIDVAIFWRQKFDQRKKLRA